MGLKKLAGKIDAYNDRLLSGKATKIRPDHVEEVMEKLLLKEKSLTDQIADATAGSEGVARLELKLKVAREHIARAKLLLNEIQKA